MKHLHIKWHLIFNSPHQAFHLTVEGNYTTNNKDDDDDNNKILPTHMSSVQRRKWKADPLRAAPAANEPPPPPRAGRAVNGMTHRGPRPALSMGNLGAKGSQAVRKHSPHGEAKETKPKPKQEVTFALHH